jgi:hypothetical protein
MKVTIPAKYLSIALPAAFLSFIMLASGCNSRKEKPIAADDFTVQFLSKKVNDVAATITFFTDFETETGEPADPGEMFTLRDKANLRAIVNLRGLPVEKYPELMFHLDWISPNERSFFTRRTDLVAFNPDTALQSSISLSPDRRQPGIYRLKVYYFRELIAMKSVELLPPLSLNSQLAGHFSPEITFCTGIDRKSGDRLGVDSVFNIQETKRIHAFIDFAHNNDHSLSALSFRIEWIAPDSTVFFSKSHEITPVDETSMLSSSISVSPDKRAAGKYQLRVFLFEEFIANKRFELKE